jgi:hypothetical protein
MPGACARACARAGARVRACACGRDAGARAFQLSFGKLFCGNPQESGFFRESLRLGLTWRRCPTILVLSATAQRQPPPFFDNQNFAGMLARQAAAQAGASKEWQTLAKR